MRHYSVGMGIGGELVDASPSAGGGSTSYNFAQDAGPRGGGSCDRGDDDKLCGIFEDDIMRNSQNGMDGKMCQWCNIFERDCECFECGVCFNLKDECTCEIGANQTGAEDDTDHDDGQDSKDVIESKHAKTLVTDSGESNGKETSSCPTPENSPPESLKQAGECHDFFASPKRTKSAKIAEREQLMKSPSPLYKCSNIGNLVAVAVTQSPLSGNTLTLTESESPCTKEKTKKAKTQRKKNRSRKEKSPESSQVSKTEKSGKKKQKIIEKAADGDMSPQRDDVQKKKKSPPFSNERNDVEGRKRKSSNNNEAKAVSSSRETKKVKGCNKDVAIPKEIVCGKNSPSSQVSPLGSKKRKRIISKIERRLLFSSPSNKKKKKADSVVSVRATNPNKNPPNSTTEEITTAINNDNESKLREHKKCKHHDTSNNKRCANFAQLNGLCCKHSPYIQCLTEACTNIAKNRGLCVQCAYPQKRICKHAGCTKSAQKGGKCTKHGGTTAHKQCSIEGCIKLAVAGGCCMRHGPERGQCELDGCENIEYRAGLGRCQKHKLKVRLKLYEKQLIAGGGFVEST